MPKKKEKPLQNTLQIVWEDGHVESVTASPEEIRSRFRNLVFDCCSRYVDSLREIRLLDNAGHVFRSFHQNF